MHLSSETADAARNPGKTQKKPEHGDGTSMKKRVVTGAERNKDENTEAKRAKEREQRERQGRGSPGPTVGCLMAR